jgi:hypothetical protein
MTKIQMPKRLRQELAPLERKCSRLEQRYARVDSGKNGEAYRDALLDYQTVLENLTVALKAALNPRTRGPKAKPLNRLASFSALPTGLMNFCSEVQRRKLTGGASTAGRLSARR